MSKIERYQVGPRMSGIVVHNGTVYLSGYVAENTAGQSVAAQTGDILEQIDRALASVNSDKTRLLQATIWLADMSTFAEMNSVWDKWVSPGNTPVRACVEAKLALPKYTVEIRVIAAQH
jgi:enamine deaminase RidA (YjgF/YER057c/UK114 family)